MQRKIRPYILKENNWKSIKELKYEVAVLPWGATEAHNYHLPYGTDAYLAEALAVESARKAWEMGAKVLVLPEVPFGVNTGQIEIPFCMNMNPSTQLMVLKDLVQVLSHHQVQKLIILNAHGGNNFKQMIRELFGAFPEVFVASVNWWNSANRNDFFEKPGDHADEMETSVMMHFHPELVLSLDEAGSGTSIPYRVSALKEGWATTQRLWHKATIDTGVGDPSLSTAEKGRDFVTATSDRIAQFINELAFIDLNELYGE